jgi:hypothetical protein
VLALAEPCTLDGVRLLRAALAAIEANPDRWDQRVYRGAPHGVEVFCLAGWVCHLAGHDVHAMLQADPLSVFRCARTLLGINQTQAERLFLFQREDLTIQRYRRHITNITGITFDK